MTTRLAELRLSKKLSQREVAERAGLHIRTIQQIEAGADPRLSTAVKIAEALEVSVLDLVVNGQEAA